MLDREVTAALRNNPEAFSKLLHRLLGESNSSAAVTFEGKRRQRIPKGKASRQTRDEPDDPPALESPPLRLPETAENVWDDDVVDDVKNKIYSALFVQSLDDGSVFLDLVLLAFVTKSMHKSLKPRLRELEARINVIPLYCRALFEYIRDPSTFRLFLTRIEKPAPAVHAAWKVLLHHNALLKAEFGGIIAALTTEERMRDFYAALANDGCDPIATAICMHHLAQPGDGFSEENLTTLTDLVLDKTWSMFMMPFDALMTAKVPRLFDMRHLLHACTVRFELNGSIDAEDQFMAILKRFGTMRRPRQLHAWPMRKDGMAKRLAKIGPDLPLKVVLFTRERVGFRELHAHEEDILYEWMKHALHLVNLTSEDAIAAILDAVAHGVAFMRAFAQDVDPAARAFMGAVARFLAHPRVPANISLAVIFRLDYPHWVNAVAVQLLEYAIKFGHRELVRGWIQSIGRDFGGRGPFLTPQRTSRLMRLATSVDVVAKHDLTAETQDLVCDFLVENVPGSFDLSTWRRGEGVCIGDHFMNLATRTELPQKYMNIFRQGKTLYDALRCERANGELLMAIGLVDDPPNRVYHTAIYIASKLALWKPDFARFILEKVFNYLSTLLMAGANIEAAELFYDLGYLSAESAYYFVYSEVFGQFFASSTYENRGNTMAEMPALLAQLFARASSLPVINRAISKMPVGLSAEVLLKLADPPFYVRDDEAEIAVFISWNTSFRFIRRFEYGYLSRVENRDIRVQMAEIEKKFWEVEDRAILAFFSSSSVKSISVLERLYVLARPFLQHHK